MYNFDTKVPRIVPLHEPMDELSELFVHIENDTVCHIMCVNGICTSDNELVSLKSMEEYYDAINAYEAEFNLIPVMTYSTTRVGDYLITKINHFFAHDLCSFECYIVQQAVLTKG